MSRATICLNGSLQPASENDNLPYIVVYEVVRVVHGMPLFLQEHWQRLLQSAAMRLPALPEISSVLDGMQLVIADNQLVNGNIEVQFNQEQSLLIKIIPHRYPTAEMYASGVCLGILEAERANPNAKEKNQSLRDRANELMQQHDNYEVLLVDHHGNITEGSRSNIFFVRDNQVFTSPTDAVLQGITRQKIVEICSKQELPLHETTIPLSELSHFDAAFMTGTSPAVLPVRKIGETIFAPQHAVVLKIMEAYQAVVEEDLRRF